MTLAIKLEESSLSRIWTQNENFDCGALTAFRKAENCGEGKEFTKKENEARNKSLLAKLKSKNYSVISLLGTYPEGGKTTKEKSFFVVDINETGNLKKDLLKLGEEFEQDSILFVPKGAIKGDEKAYLIGTNKCENSFPGFNQKFEFEKGKLGYDSPIYTSKVNGRPFIFEEVQGEVHLNTGFAVWAANLIAVKNWKELL